MPGKGLKEVIMQLGQIYISKFDTVLVLAGGCDLYSKEEKYKLGTEDILRDFDRTVKMIESNGSRAIICPILLKVFQSQRHPKFVLTDESVRSFNKAAKYINRNFTFIKFLLNVH